MPNPTIQLDNTTLGAITLTQLGLVVPASGSIMATGSVLVDDVVNDPELTLFIDNGDITLTVNAVALTVEQSIAYVDYDRVKENLAAVLAPTNNDDDDAGYAIGSHWVNTATNTTYLCVDATTNTAVWACLGGDGAFGSPVTIGTANSDGTAATVNHSDHVHAHGAQTDETLHAVATTVLDGFMSAEDKTKLDSLVGTNGGTEFSSTPTSTSLGTYQDAFPGQNFTVVDTGMYMIQFEGNIEGSSGNTVNEIGITIDTVIVADSERVMQGNGGASISTYCHTFQNLTAGEVVTGVFRKNSGSGTTTMGNRRFTVLQLSITP